MIEYGLIGEKLGHSFSKEIHSMIADYDYQLLELAPHELEGFLTEKKFKAVNVTIPYKQKVIPFLDEITEAAGSIGAVNCIRNDGGRLTGHNTDFDGLKALLEHNGTKVAGKKVLILGTGGTSDTAYGVCLALKAKEIIKVSRRQQEGAATYEEATRNHRDTEVIINTTPCGMHPDLFKRPVDLDEFPNLLGVADVVYNPLRTRLVSQALSKGINAQGGLYMLTAQAVKASEFFLGKGYPENLTEKIYSKIYADKCNIVLTGMPGAGKSTIGRLIAKELGREFYDTDELITQSRAKTIPEIFAECGEAGFREIETEIIQKFSCRSGIVIATGGGAVLKKENRDALKMNGKVFFLDRPPELLLPTDDRPLAFSSEEIYKRYEERYSTYVSTADKVVENCGLLTQAVGKILEEFK